MMRALLAVPEWRDMYFRRLRTQVNDILAPGRLEAQYDALMGPAQPEATLDFARWPRGGTVTYAQQRTALFNAINARRTAFANDARVPGNQSAAPNIVTQITRTSASASAHVGVSFRTYRPKTWNATQATIAIRPATATISRNLASGAQKRESSMGTPEGRGL